MLMLIYRALAGTTTVTVSIIILPALTMAIESVKQNIVDEIRDVLSVEVFTF